jgi:hypothetical protein
MKTINLTLKEYMVLRELANKYHYKYEPKYLKNKLVEVTIEEEFLDAFGF